MSQAVCHRSKQMVDGRSNVCRGKMAKYFIDVVRDSPSTRLGTAYKTKNPLSRTNTPPAELPFGFKLHGRLVSAYSRVRIFRRLFAQTPPPPPPPPLVARPLGLTDQPRQPREEKDPSPNRRGKPSPPGTYDQGCRSRCDFYSPSPLFRSRRPSSSLFFITSMTNDLMSVEGLRLGRT